MSRPGSVALALGAAELHCLVVPAAQPARQLRPPRGAPPAHADRGATWQSRLARLSVALRTWNGAILQGPWTLHLANMAGECRAWAASGSEACFMRISGPVQGFRETSLLVHLRRSAAEVFSTSACGRWRLEMRCGLPTGGPRLRR